jgi:N-acyl-D-amino-acid deacylase
MRNEDDHLLEAIDEAVAIARGAGCPLQISHLKTERPRNWNKIDAVFARIDSAKHSGLDEDDQKIGAYIKGNSGLAGAIPAWKIKKLLDCFPPTISTTF